MLDRVVLVPNATTDDLYDPAIELEYDAERRELYVVVGEEMASMAETVPPATWKRIVSTLTQLNA